MHVFDDTPCELGEGPLWHPLNQKLYWFDILKNTLFCKGIDDSQAQQWHFEENVSAAGWIDEQQLLIASQSSLFIFNLQTEQKKFVCDLEADKPLNRSNDGRADPFGGFWIGTMAFDAQPKAGSIYRYYRGELRQLVANITITNAICFSPDKQFAYYTDTAEQVIWRQALNQNDGWLEGEPQVFLDLTEQNLNPDGAIIDAQGNMWVAQWGASRVAQYSTNGEFLQAVEAPTEHSTCPAFGGNNLQRLFITTSKAWLSADKAAKQPAGQTFHIEMDCCGVAEPKVIIDA